MLIPLLLFVTLFAVWVIFSGFITPFFLALGAVSCALAVWVARRMVVIDHERHPLYLKPKAPLYFLWLFKEILLSSFSVALKVWHISPAISPTLAWVKASQKREEGQVVYGNSITLTPGTVCTDIQGKQIQVHALTTEGLEDLRKNIMHKKVIEAVE